jgi:2-methylcitrate dehydratase PrpD
MDFAAFGNEARVDAAPLAAKVRLLVADPYATSYPVSWGAGITVEMTDGTRVESVTTECKGDPEAALSADEMITKARDLMRYAGVNDSARIIDGVLDLANGGKAIDVNDLLVA